MKAVKLSTLNRDLLAGDTVPLERKRALLRAIDETYFAVDIGPWCQVYDGGAPTIVKNGNLLVTRFAAAAGANVHQLRTVSARNLWPKTVPRLNLWYTSPGASTATFTVRFALWTVGPGALTSLAAVFAVDLLAPGPAIANTEMFATIKGGAAFPSMPFGGAEFRIGRINGDANANALDIILAQIVMEESA